MMETVTCKGCPYYGVVDVDAEGNLIWMCTRIDCIETD